MAVGTPAGPDASWLLDPRADPVAAWRALPHGDGLRYELLDGTLVVAPPATPEHARLATRLTVLLESTRAGRPWWVLQAAGVRLDDRSAVIPDLLVGRPAPAVAEYDPADVLLVVEVESPGSLGNDRVVKARGYAAAGIPSYWRVERDPLVVRVHALRAGGYDEVAAVTADGEVALDAPWPLVLRGADLVR